MLRRTEVNKLVDAKISSDNTPKAAGSTAYWNKDYERRLKALFEAIVAEDIVNRPSPDDIEVTREISK